MPTECERSLTSPTGLKTESTTTEEGVASAALIAAEIQSSVNSYEDSDHHHQQQQQNTIMEGDMSTSQTSTTSNGSSCNGGGTRKTSITSPDPTAYVAKARVTRPTPPPPPYNPMQFVQIKPCNLYQTAQEQLKKAEEVKKIKEIRKEEPEDWQNNLDNWKSSRRKRVEHIIDRVVEVKKLELEEHDRTRRKSKTFSELIENRGERVGRPGLNKLASLAVYNEDESNDLSDLGIGTSSASGKSSLSEDYDNNSVMSDNAAELDKAISNSNHKQPPNDSSTTREYISSPGYETSSSTAPASSPDPCEYTYEGAIQDYKQRVSRAASGLTLGKISSTNNGSSTQLQQHQQHQQQLSTNSKESTPERGLVKESSSYPPRRGSKIEDRLIGFEVQSPSEECISSEKNKVDVPKIDILKRKEIFESQSGSETKLSANSGGGNALAGVPRVTLRDRFKPQESLQESSSTELIAKKDLRRMSGDITSIKERLQNLEQSNPLNGANGLGSKSSSSATNKLVDITVPPLKERLSSLQSAVTKEEIRKPPVALVDARQLEIMKSEEAKRVKKTIKEENKNLKIEEKSVLRSQVPQAEVEEDRQEVEVEAEVDRDDSGIHTADDIDIVEERLTTTTITTTSSTTKLINKEQELKLNAAIEALAMEEKQFAEAATAVNQIEAEFEELTLGSSVTLPPLASSAANTNGIASSSTTTTTNNSSTSTSTTITTNDHMEYSVSSTNQKNTLCLSSSPSKLSLIKSPGSDSSCINTNSSLMSPNIEVKGLKIESSAPAGPSTAQSPPGSSLRRKPTNEMVHAKNLLKIFNETFQNDIELDDDHNDDDYRNEQEIKKIPYNQNQNQNPRENLMTKNVIIPNNDQNLKGKVSAMNVTVKVIENTQKLIDNEKENSALVNKNAAPSGRPFSPLSPSSGYPVSPSSVNSISSPSVVAPSSPGSSATMIPRSVAANIKSPPSSPLSPSVSTPPSPAFSTPLSPLTIRSTTKFKVDTPPGSPFASRKHDSQFSINGRVEIFNSKNMATPPVSQLPRPATPNAATARKNYLPHITTTTATPPPSLPSTPIATSDADAEAAFAKSSQSNDIRLPPKQLKETALHSQKGEVIESATTTTTTVINSFSKEETKPMLSSRQMRVNEPQAMPVAGITKITAITTTSNVADERKIANAINIEAGQQQQQQQHQHFPSSPPPHEPEIIMCAPPHTIVNPDELPKPNTVKNLSNCFQQQHHDAPPPIPSPTLGKLISPKPLQRSRIPQAAAAASATPPQSPITLRRNVAANTSGEKTKVIWPPVQETSTLATASSTSITSTTSTTSPALTTSLPLDEEMKKLSINSSSSTSSNSTACTVIEAKRQLSIMSNLSGDNSQHLSIMSNSSADSSIVLPTFGETNAQIHKNAEGGVEAPLSPGVKAIQKVFQGTVNDSSKGSGIKTYQSIGAKSLGIQLNIEPYESQTESTELMKPSETKTSFESTKPSDETKISSGINISSQSTKSSETKTVTESTKPSDETIISSETKTSFEPTKPSGINTSFESGKPSDTTKISSETKTFSISTKPSEINTSFESGKPSHTTKISSETKTFSESTKPSGINTSFESRKPSDTTKISSETKTFSISTKPSEINTSFESGKPSDQAKISSETKTSSESKKHSETKTTSPHQPLEIKSLKNSSNEVSTLKPLESLVKNSVEDAAIGNPMESKEFSHQDYKDLLKNFIEIESKFSIMSQNKLKSPDKDALMESKSTQTAKHSKMEEKSVQTPKKTAVDQSIQKAKDIKKESHSIKESTEEIKGNQSPKETKMENKSVHTAMETSTGEATTPSDSAPAKQRQAVQRKSSLKMARNDGEEKPLKTVIFSNDVSNDSQAKDEKSNVTNDTQKKDGKSDESIALEQIKANQKDFLHRETEFSQSCETKPPATDPPFHSPLQPIKVTVRDNDVVKGNVQTPVPKAEMESQEMEYKFLPRRPASHDRPSAALVQSKKSPLTIDIGLEDFKIDSSLPATPLSPSSQLFKTTKPLVVSTLYEKYTNESPKTPKPRETSSNQKVEPLNNQRSSTSKKEEKPPTPSIVIPAELPHLVDCPPNDSTLYKLANSAPHSPVMSPHSPHSPNSPLSPTKSLELDAALCSNLLQSMAATPDMVNFQRQQTVEEIPCVKIDVNDKPVEKVISSTDYKEISKEDVKQSEGFVSKIIHIMQSPKMRRQKTVEEEPCQKLDVRDLPDGKYYPITDYHSVSPSDVQKCDKFFSSSSVGGRSPQSPPINEARAAHSKALIETCEKIIKEEKEANNQMKSSFPKTEPMGSPATARKSKIPKPLPSCCKGTDSLTEADLEAKVSGSSSGTPKSPTTPNKDEAVIARMHVVETQIKVTTTTPPSSPTEKEAKLPTSFPESGKPIEAKPQSSKPSSATPLATKKTKNIFDFLKKNFGIGGDSNASGSSGSGSSSGITLVSHKDTEDNMDSKSKLIVVPPPPSVVQSENKVLVLTPDDVKNFDQFDEIHNVDNSKFYLPADDVAPPPLPKSPAPVNIEITRKIITDEIVEDGKSEMELTDEIDALLDVEFSKLNQEIEEMEKAGKKKK